jgi:hypothetical protein
MRCEIAASRAWFSASIRASNSSHVCATLRPSQARPVSRLVWRRPRSTQALDVIRAKLNSVVIAHNLIQDVLRNTRRDRQHVTTDFLCDFSPPQFRFVLNRSGPQLQIRRVLERRQIQVCTRFTDLQFARRKQHLGCHRSTSGGGSVAVGQQFIQNRVGFPQSPRPQPLV